MGDIVFQRIAEIIKKTIKITDLACRWGDEEFIIIYQNTNINQALEVSEKLRNLIFELAFDEVKYVSCSF